MNFLQKLTGVIALLTAVSVLSGCEAVFDTPLVYLSEDESRRKAIDIDCTVKQMFVTEREVSYGGIAYGYGNKGFGYVAAPNRGARTVRTYYVILEDSNGQDLRFIIDDKDYSLLAEGDNITIQYIKRYTEDGMPYDASKNLFYWGTSKLTLDADVTSQLADTIQEGENS